MEPGNPTKKYLCWVRRLYNERSPSYENSWHPAFAAEVMGSIPGLQQGASVLDLAAGTGLCTFAAAARVAPSGRVLGIDFCEGMLGIARSKKETFVENMTRLHGHYDETSIELLQHDITDLESLDALQGHQGTFDVVICASALVLLPNPQSAISKWAQYLKPSSGRMILDVPHPKNLRAGAIMEIAASEISLRSKLPYNRLWISSESSLCALLEACVDAAGNTLLQVEGIRFVEQAGYGTRWYSGRREAAEKLFEDAVKPFEVENDFDKKAQLREAFVLEWGKAAGEESSVEEVDGVFVATAKRI